MLLFEKPNWAQSGTGRIMRLLLLLILSIFLSTGQAAEWSKLKKCSDLGFCRRHRHYEAAAEAVYKVVAETFKIGTWKGSDAITASVRSDKGTSLLLVITIVANGIFRVVLDDEQKLKHDRYSVSDTMLSNVKPLTIEKEILNIFDEGAEIIPKRSATNMYVNFNPFRVDFVRDDSRVVTSINAHNRLLVEDFAEKPTPSPSPSPSPAAVEAQSPTPETATPSAGSTENEGPNTSGNSEVEEEHGDHGDQKDDHIDSGDDYDSDYDDDDDGESASDQLKTDSAEFGCDGCWSEKFQSHHDPKLRGPESVGVDISFPNARHIYGLPQRTVSFSLGDTVGPSNEVLTEPLRMYNLDVFEFELEKPLGLYGSIPLIYARNGKESAGLLWMNSAETYVDVINSEKDVGKKTHWYSEAGIIDIYFFAGPGPSSVFEQYMSLTGAPAMPPRFSLGYHQCRWNYRDDEDSRAVDRGFDEQDIPYDVLWLDIEHTNGKRYFTWDTTKFPDPTALQNYIAARGRKMVTIIDPHVKRDNKYSLHRLGKTEKLYVTNPDGSDFDGWCWPGSSSYFDFTSAKVREVWAGLFNPTDYPHFTEHLYTWNDMNEPSVFNGPEGTMQKNLIHEGNVEHRLIHNIYGHFFMQATYEGLLKGHGGNDRPFVLSRSFFAGSQKYGAIWTGDNTADWEHLGSSVRMLLPLQITGMIFSGADVGGFFGNPSAELLTRWYQTGAFQPFFRGHAHLDTNRREPWIFGEPYTTHIAEAIRTRYQYIPYWYTLFAANALGIEVGFTLGSRGPPMRPMWWHFPGDEISSTNERQWMVGSALLVAPVLNEGATSHSLYVPPEVAWYDLFSPETPGKKFEEVGDVQIDVTLDRMVVLQRGGTIIPKQERRRRSTRAMARDPYTLVVALSLEENAFGELYLDDGRTFDHQKGAYALRRFLYKDGELKATIASGGQVEFEGRDATIERVVLLGFGEEPKSVKAGDRDIDFVLAKDTGVLTLQRVNLAAGFGEWTISIK